MTPDDRFTQITLRIPKELHSRLRAAASEAAHSQNAEIVQRLERSFADNDAVGYDATTARLEGAIANLRDLYDRIPLQDVLDFLEDRETKGAGAKRKRGVAKPP